MASKKLKIHFGVKLDNILTLPICKNESVHARNIIFSWDGVTCMKCLSLKSQALKQALRDRPMVHCAIVKGDY